MDIVFCSYWLCCLEAEDEKIILILKNFIYLLQHVHIMGKTTIQISRSTLERLKMLKVLGKQSYDGILNNLIDNTEDEILSEEEIKEIKEGLENIKKGHVKSIEEVAKDLGIVLHKASI